MELDGNTFFIFNKKYVHAKLTQSDYDHRVIHTHEQGINTGQLWILTESQTNSGYYYVKNVKHEGYRLAKYGAEDDKLSAYNGQYYDDQLWRFDQAGDYYIIRNKAYPTARLCKYGKKDDNVGTYDGPFFDDQCWKLVPRFSAEAREVEIWNCDNRQGTEEVTKEIKTTVGVVLTKSKTVTTTVGFQQSLTFSLSGAFKGITAGMESTTTFSKQIESSVGSSEAKSWSKETTTKYTAPPGKKYRVLQTLVDFSSHLDADDCCLYCTERIEESS